MAGRDCYNCVRLLYNVRLSDGHVWKCHQDQLRKCYIDTAESDVDNYVSIFVLGSLLKKFERRRCNDCVDYAFCCVLTRISRDSLMLAMRILFSCLCKVRSRILTSLSFDS